MYRSWGLSDHSVKLWRFGYASNIWIWMPQHSGRECMCLKKPSGCAVTTNSLRGMPILGKYFRNEKISKNVSCIDFMLEFDPRVFAVRLFIAWPAACRVAKVEAGGLVHPDPIDTLHRVLRWREVLLQRRHHRRQHPYCIHGSNKNIAPDTSQGVTSSHSNSFSNADCKESYKKTALLFLFLGYGFIHVSIIFY